VPIPHGNKGLRNRRMPRTQVSRLIYLRCNELIDRTEATKQNQIVGIANAITNNCDKLAVDPSIDNVGAKILAKNTITFDV
jgi:hypothetical protein